MTLQELYAQMGADYQGAQARLRTDALIGTLVLAVLDDPAFPAVAQAWAKGDRKAAFEAAHTAKGVCSSLSLTTLGACATELTDALREGSAADDATADALVARFGELYARTAKLIRAYADSR